MATRVCGPFPTTRAIVGVKLPADTVIAREKVCDYLLVPQPRNDKAGFLNRAGFHAGDPDALLQALERLRVEIDVEPAGSNTFGRYWVGDGLLTGPHGVRLQVRTVWMTEHLSGCTKFITLVPTGIISP